MLLYVIWCVLANDFDHISLIYVGKSLLQMAVNFVLRVLFYGNHFTLDIFRYNERLCLKVLPLLDTEIIICLK